MRYDSRSQVCPTTVSLPETAFLGDHSGGRQRVGPARRETRAAPNATSSAARAHFARSGSPAGAPRPPGRSRPARLDVVGASGNRRVCVRKGERANGGEGHAQPGRGPVRVRGSLGGRGVNAGHLQWRIAVNDIRRDEIMRFADPYTKAILTIIAVLLAWNTLGRLRVPAVHAQSTSSRYFVEQISADWMSKQYQTDLAAAINNAAKGRQLVTVLPFDQQGNYLAVYK